MVPNVFSKFDWRLFISKFFQFPFYLCLPLAVISKSLAQPCCKCCNFSVSIVLNVRFTTDMDVREEQHPYICDTNKQK